MTRTNFAALTAEQKQIWANDILCKSGYDKTFIKNETVKRSGKKRKVKRNNKGLTSNKG